MSFDPDSGILKYGIGHHMEETTLIVYSLPPSMSCLFRTTPKLVCLHGYSSGPVERRSIFEAKLCTLDGNQVCLMAADKQTMATGNRMQQTHAF